MADVKWVGGAAAVAEVRDFTIGGTWANADTISVKVGSKTLTVTLGSTSAASVTAVAAALVAAFNGAAVTADETRDFTGDEVPEMNEITASANAGALTLTHDTAGVPFTATLSKSSTSGTVSSATVTTAATGPNDWANAGNWSGGAVPVNSDIVFFEDSAVDVLYGLGQGSLTLAALHIHSTYTGNIGLDSLRNRVTEATQYGEYRTKNLTLGGTPTVYIGKGDGDGSPRIRLQFGGSATVYVHSTGTSAVDGHPAVFISGGSSSSLSIYGGTVWVGGEGGDAIGFTAITIAGTEDSTPEVTIGHEGSGTTGTVHVSNAVVQLDSASGSLLARANSEVFLLSAWNAGNVTVIDGGVVRPRGPIKTCANISVFDGGHFDCTGFDAGGVSVSGLFTVYAGSEITFPSGTTPPTISVAAGVGIVGRNTGVSLAKLNLPIGSTGIIDFL